VRRAASFEEDEQSRVSIEVDFYGLEVVSKISEEREARQETFDVSAEVKIDMPRLKSLVVKAARNRTRMARALKDVIVVKVLSAKPSKVADGRQEEMPWDGRSR